MPMREERAQSLDETRDPKATAGGVANAASAHVPCIDIVFHPDLRRVGDTHTIHPLRDAGAVCIGRAEPEFHSEASAEPLGDPCISRSQVEVRFRAEEGTFEVRCHEGARRVVQVCDGSMKDCVALLSTPTVVPPGRYLRIGDRVLLRLSLRRVSPASLGMVGISESMAALRRLIEVVAGTDAPVLVTGETGTGKELVAQALHEASPRRRQSFTAFNCAALQDTLVESALFGHVKGAFAGATDNLGLFRAAGSGTLLLDEIGDLTPLAQAKLLRALQERSVLPVGSTANEPVRARFAFTTHRDLAAMVDAGTFRRDLLHRIEVVRVKVPPLRERLEDVPLLFARFLCMDPAAAELGLVREVGDSPPRVPMDHVGKLLAHDWSGNVRELRHHVAKLLAQTAARGQFSAPELEPGVVPPPLRGAPVEAATTPEDEHFSRAQQAVLAQKGNLSNAAKALGISRTKLYRWLREAPPRSASALDAAAIEDARRAAGGNVDKGARILGVTPEVLRARMRELGGKA